jgi:hypothetical protein
MNKSELKLMLDETVHGINEALKIKDWFEDEHIHHQRGCDGRVETLTEPLTLKNNLDALERRISEMLLKLFLRSKVYIMKNVL